MCKCTRKDTGRNHPRSFSMLEYLTEITGNAFGQGRFRAGGLGIGDWGRLQGGVSGTGWGWGVGL